MHNYSYIYFKYNFEKRTNMYSKYSTIKEYVYLENQFIFCF